MISTGHWRHIGRGSKSRDMLYFYNKFLHFALYIFENLKMSSAVLPKFRASFLFFFFFLGAKKSLIAGNALFLQWYIYAQYQTAYLELWSVNRNLEQTSKFALTIISNANIWPCLKIFVSHLPSTKLLYLIRAWKYNIIISKQSSEADLLSAARWGLKSLVEKQKHICNNIIPLWKKQAPFFCLCLISIIGDHLCGAKFAGVSIIVGRPEKEREILWMNLEYGFYLDTLLKVFALTNWIKKKNLSVWSKS